MELTLAQKYARRVANGRLRAFVELRIVYHAGQNREAIVSTFCQFWAFRLHCVGCRTLREGPCRFRDRTASVAPQGCTYIADEIWLRCQRPERATGRGLL
jgi:hypothetical protein